MNYQWHYDRLIKSRKNRILIEGAYYEKHHILPKSMGGDNSDENLVYLTAREHFIAHWLLWRIHKNREMSAAFLYMNKMKKYKGFSSIAYAEMKEKGPWNKGLKGIAPGNKGKKTGKPSWNAGKKMSEESRKKMSVAKLGKPGSSKGKPSPYRGTTNRYTEETLEKMRNSAKNRKMK